MKRKYIFPLVLIGGTGIYLIINRIHKKSLYNKLMSDLTTGANSEDVVQELGVLTQSGGALDPGYYKTVSSTLLSANDVTADAKKLNGWIHGLFGLSDESSIIAFFQGLKNKAQVSQIAEAYLKAYAISLGDDLKTIDYTLFSLPIGTPNLPKVQSAIQSLPDK